jgi:Tfp pilus assembly protein PilF
MSLRSGIVLSLLSLAPFASMTAGAEDYWAYAYQGVEIISTGNPASAVTLAHHLHRLDLAARKFLLSDREGGERPATHIYAVSPWVFSEMVGGDKDVGMLYQYSGTDNYVLLNGTRSPGSDDPYWPAYAGYAGSILMSDGESRYPYWFRTGFAELFAATAFQGSKVTLGGYAKGRVYSLTSDKLIPVHTLLQLQPGDPQLKANAYLYPAECWFLLHLVLFEGNYRAEFARYLTLIDEGQSPEEAFAGSFKVGYDALDKMLRSALTTGRVNIFVLHIDDDRDTEAPHRISPAEANARIAEFELRLGRIEEAIKRVQSALASEPSNEMALRVLATAQVRRHDYADALRTIDRLPADAGLSPDGHSDRAAVLMSTAQAAASKDATLSADPVELNHRATADLQRALELAPENRHYLEQLGRLIAEQRDTVTAQTYFPRAVHVFYQHPRDAALAAAIAQMCAATGDYKNAVRFTEAWRDNTIAPADRDRAAAYLSRLKTAQDQHSVIAGDASSTSP